jgi:hypothetical protein
VIQGDPVVESWERVRNRIREEFAAGNLAPDAERHDEIAQALWHEMLGIWTPSLAMAVWYMPEIYSLWPAYWHDHVLRQYATGKHCAIGGPRRRAKSALFRAHQLHAMLTLKYTFSSHMCLSPELVLEHSSAVIDQLEHNKRLQADFNIHPGTVQRQEHFQVQVGKSHRTTLKFEWLTRDGDPRGTGRHLFGADDIDTPTDTPYVMQKYYDKLHGSVLGTLEPYEGNRGQFIYSGNLTGVHSNLVMFQKRDAVLDPDNWIVMLIPAMEVGKTTAITKVKVGESTWPDRFSTKDTLTQIHSMNMSRMRSGDMELQNELADVGKLIWTDDMFQLRFKPGDAAPHQCVSRVYIDSAQKTTEAGDDWAIGRITKVIDGPHKGEFWIERVYMDPLDPDTAIDIALDFCVGTGTPRNPQCRVVKMESKTDKGVDPFLNDLQKTARRERGMYVQVGQIVASKDKRTRSLEAVHIGNSRSLRTPEVWDEHMRRCVEQMCTFTGESGQHLKAIDDGHDMVVHGINDLKRLRNHEEDEDEHEHKLAEFKRLPAMRTRAA